MPSTGQGTVFNIQRFSTKDGPGIRTTVFLKGCNLACRWCHNPESIAPGPQLQYFVEHCLGCGACVSTCPKGCHRIGEGKHVFSREDCAACGRCAGKCRVGALSLCGRVMAPGEAFDIVVRDRRYYENSGGGLTVSGGEPLLQPEFCRRLLSMTAEAGIHTAVDTALNLPWETVEGFLPLVGLWLVDVKGMNAGAHRRNTGVENGRILSNLAGLLRSGMRVFVRVPLTAGLNDDDAFMEDLGRFLAENGGAETAELIPYHNFGVYKAESLGLARQAETFSSPPPQRLRQLRDRLTERGIRCV